MLDRLFAIYGDPWAAMRTRTTPGPVQRDGQVAVVTIAGPTSRSGIIDGEPSGTSTDAARREINALAADPNVKAIVLFVQSGGGMVQGTGDLADAIWAARQQKYVGAFIRDIGASAAYWAASQATQVFSDPMAIVGSIGTYSVIPDLSGMAGQLGVKVHVIRAGQFKGAGVPGSEITAEQLAEMQRNVDALNEHFLAGVARGRKMRIERVRELADGRVHVGDEARKLGLIDGVTSFSSFLSQVRAAFPAPAQASHHEPKKGFSMFESEKEKGASSAEFWDAVEQRVKAGQPKQRAISAVVHDQPELHRAMLAESNGRRR